MNAYARVRETKPDRRTAWPQSSTTSPAGHPEASARAKQKAALCYSLASYPSCKPWAVWLTRRLNDATRFATGQHSTRREREGHQPAVMAQGPDFRDIWISSPPPLLYLFHSFCPRCSSSIALRIARHTAAPSRSPSASNASAHLAARRLASSPKVGAPGIERRPVSVGAGSRAGSCRRCRRPRGRSCG